jgi:hypothetical protein
MNSTFTLLSLTHTLASLEQETYDGLNIADLTMLAIRWIISGVFQKDFDSR